jgi:hypothetical protein
MIDWLSRSIILEIAAIIQLQDTKDRNEPYYRMILWIQNAQLLCMNYNILKHSAF